jgi:hypothetical protein
MKRSVLAVISLPLLFASTFLLAAQKPHSPDSRTSLFGPEDTIPDDDEETCWVAPEWRDDIYGDCWVAPEWRD